MDKLIDLLNYNQSYWLDNLSREKIRSGELKKRVEEQGLRGITSNPSIFNKAIAGSKEYDDQVALLAREGKTPEEIYDELTIKDVQDACDILKSVYENSNGEDGFVSLEVSPYLARDTEGTIREARRLFKAVGRKNCMIKIPGTKECIPAIEQTLAEGININITLLFSVERYSEVAHAYIRALEQRLSEGKKLKDEPVISVASIFLSRIDVLTDELLAQRIVSFQEKENNDRIGLMLGKAGVATARMAYQRFREIFSTSAWKKFHDENVPVQRVLWASTSTKNPLYNDLMYVDTLIGENTINTLPDETILAFQDHGKLKRNSIEEEVEESRHFFSELKKLGLDIDFITQQLENEGVRKFMEAYRELISNLATKRTEILGDQISNQKISCRKLEKEIKAANLAIDEKQAGKLLFAKNPDLWRKDEKQTDEIRQRLGWLTLPEDYSGNVKELVEFAGEVKEFGYEFAVLLGMGGSSLCSEVARETFGTENGFLQLFVLDDTSPEAILDLEKKINIEKTLFIVASKSGTTQETLCFFRYFHNQLEKKKIINPGNNFVAITDEGTPLAKLGEDYQFRKIFVNPSDLGGRYSVLSDFGLVPMALMGIDIASFLESARQMESSCKYVPSATNPGMSLGILLGICQRHGRDKVTFVLSSSISSFGYWVEQLLAESTGKEGRGLIPVNGEPVGTPEEYGNDRVFIHLLLASDKNEEEKKLAALENAGHPVVRIKLPSKNSLGGEYYKWEIAAAIAGMVMEINPFDQPNVEESKKNTKEFLEEWNREGVFKKTDPELQIENISIYSGKANEFSQGKSYETTGDFLTEFLGQAVADSYVAFLPYFLLTDTRTKILQDWREHIRNELKIATTLLNGPRYLHSTGQLHKGGPNSGHFILLLGDEKSNLAIPGEKFGFRTLHLAQALGDFRSLDDKGRKVIRIHLGESIDEGLEKTIRSIRHSKKNLASTDSKHE
jgi:transaldolase/glucose-6-phosphate isomerase